MWTESSDPESKPSRIWVSNSKLAELIATNPYILIKRLNSPIIPFLEFLRSLVQTDENIIKALKRSRWLISCDIERQMKPNIALLQDYDVPISRISYLIMTKPGILMQKPDTLREIIDNVKNLGFKCGSGMFTLAIHVMSSMNKLTWDAKIELLKSLGWSEKEILDAFNRNPLYMTVSEKKIRAGMDFFVKKLKWKPSVVSSHPKLLTHSLKEKVIPRTTVWRILMSKDLIGEEKELIYMLNLTEDKFLEKYVTKYEEEVPYLFKAYKGELEFGWLVGNSEGKLRVGRFQKL
ncbi:uncharacterized protein LOC143859510 [Tasmannia lanceolata]|uniref:uncharacterized protein LOC143859510 n=1 Tax=Tasmannia lanceolata TaxID=3420 RepID=UPI0040642336